MDKIVCICDLPIPFPDSEYGGLVVLVAKDKAEAEALLLKRYGDHTSRELVDASLLCAKELPTSAKMASGIVEDFET